ncbi:Uncharacterised protein [Myroides odoratimimus]|nr:Uncharacterised protein [Myroides odoratimimus]
MTNLYKISWHGYSHYPNRGTGIPVQRISEPMPRSWAKILIFSLYIIEKCQFSVREINKL